MRLFERCHTHTATNGHIGSLDDIGRMIAGQIHDDQTPIRFAVTESSRHSYHYEIGILEGAESFVPSMFDLHPRLDENVSCFNAVLVVPTGIGADIGGHAGDATPVARLLASVCDTLITHPNVVNASDLNEMPGNGLYVEGSLLTRFIMGTIGLRRVRSNRVLVIIDAHPNERFARATVNAVNAARATYGLRCPRVVVLDPPLPVRGEYTPSGRAAGTVEDLERVFEVLNTHRGRVRRRRPVDPRRRRCAARELLLLKGRDRQPLGRRRGHAHPRDIDPLQRALGPRSHDGVGQRSPTSTPAS